MAMGMKVRRLRSARGILFDLDNTLYPRERGVFDRINRRIDTFVLKIAGGTADGVRALRRGYVEAYGTTLGGLIRHHGIPPEEYLDYVHDVPVDEMLAPDRTLATLLKSIRLPKVVFTNATARHAGRVLRALGVEGFFDGVCDLAATGYLGKPNPAAFRAACALLGAPPPATVFVDDLVDNVRAGDGMGMVTVLVGGGRGAGGHFSVPSVHGLEGCFSPAPWFIAPEPASAEAAPADDEGYM